jgi:hypothetical protein
MVCTRGGNDTSFVPANNKPKMFRRKKGASLPPPDNVGKALINKGAHTAGKKSLEEIRKNLQEAIAGLESELLRITTTWGVREDEHAERREVQCAMEGSRGRREDLIEENWYVMFIQRCRLHHSTSHHIHLMSHRQIFLVHTMPMHSNITKQRPSSIL